MGTLLAFGMICIAVWVLRVKEPHLERPYKVPFLPVVAILGSGFNLFLMTRTRHDTQVFFVIWSILGFIVYFLYSRRNSNLHPKQQ
jgi:APA family basic amino acid/polyamine antiporter